MDDLERLKAMQCDFQQFLLTGNGTAIAERVVETRQLSAIKRLGIYSNAYYLRLLSLLELDYPRFKAYLAVTADESLFHALGRAYVKAHPARHFAARLVGRDFSVFLAKHVPGHPQWSEFVDFEWALESALCAPDAPCLRLEDLARLQPEDWPRLKLRLHPSVTTKTLCYNVPYLWQAVRNGKELPSLEGPHSAKLWLVWRKEQQSMFQACTSTAQTFMLEAIQAGKNFEAICRGLTEWMSEEEATQFAAALLSQWLEQGIFATTTDSAPSPA